MKVLMSIKPEFVSEIIEGNKKFEYRKAIFKRSDVTSIVIYATLPYGKVVGEFEVGEIFNAAPQKIWKKTSEFSGIKKKFFNEYFEGREKAYAIQIKSFREYDVHMPLNDFNKNIKVAPQSFCYLYEGE